MHYQWPYVSGGVNAMAAAAAANPGGQVPWLGAYGFPPAIPAPCKMVPVAAIPLDDVALPLGDHQLATTKDKILHGEFVDIFSLLFRELEKKDKEDLDEKDKEKLKKLKVDRTWANWLPGYIIYAGLISRAQP